MLTAGAAWGQDADQLEPSVSVACCTWPGFQRPPSASHPLARPSVGLLTLHVEGGISSSRDHSARGHLLSRRAGAAPKAGHSSQRLCRLGCPRAEDGGNLLLCLISFLQGRSL